MLIRQCLAASPKWSDEKSNLRQSRSGIFILNARISQECLELRERYLEQGIVSRKYVDDALHVAVATVSECDMIVSWNFKHIVHFEKISLYNAINRIHGYREIFINSPSEVITYDEEAL